MYKDDLFTLDNIVNVTLDSLRKKEKKIEYEISVQFEKILEYIKKEIWKTAKNGNYTLAITRSEYNKVIGSRRYYEHVMYNIEKYLKEKGFKVEEMMLDDGYYMYEISWDIWSLD